VNALENQLTQPIATSLDNAVSIVLTSQFPAAQAQQWLETWQRVRASRTSVYDAIVIFVNLICAQSDQMAGSSAWLRVLLIDAVTQTEREEMLAA
jgi:hypothetical protein